jgi:hypothetical protein
MRKMTLLICALALAAAIGIAGETQVTVDKGKVEVNTPNGATTVEAGHKAVLSEGKAPARLLDDPLAQDAMIMYGWVKDEEAKKEVEATHSSVMVLDVQNDSYVKVAEVAELPNAGSKALEVEHIQQTLMKPGWKIYDTDGNLLTFDKTAIGDENGEPSYSVDIHLAKPVAPGDKFAFVEIWDEAHAASVLADMKLLWKDGQFWKVKFGNMSGGSLNYYEVILPKSAILIDCNMPISAALERDGRNAYVIRKVNDNWIANPEGRGEFTVTFLWPDKDGTTLKDIPEEYRTRAAGLLGGIDKVAEAVQPQASAR